MDDGAEAPALITLNVTSTLPALSKVSVPAMWLASRDPAMRAAIADDPEKVWNLTIKRNTHPVELALEFNGSTVDPYGLDRAGFAASTTISRKKFGVDIEMPMDGGGVVIGDKITIEIDAEFTREA